MELLKTEYSQNKGIGKLDKVLLKCDEPNYYELTNFMYISQNEQALILRALHAHNINIILKFGVLESIEKELYISQKLFNLPNFIRYFCMIKCNEDIKNIINNKNTIQEYKICNYGKNKIGILVMKEYNLGSVENYDWIGLEMEEGGGGGEEGGEEGGEGKGKWKGNEKVENNFLILKNVIKQVVYSTLNAYDTKGFIHGDLHTGNVLLKPARSKEINYNGKILQISKFAIVIADFEKSKLNQKNKMRDVINNICKFITCLEYGNNIKLNFDYDRNKLSSLKSPFNENIDYYNEIGKIIDNMRIYI